MGGGIVNGIRTGRSLARRTDRKNGGDDPGLRARWAASSRFGRAMADDPEVFNGTRYDALRIIGVDTWDRHGAQLCRYLKKGRESSERTGAGGDRRLGNDALRHRSAGRDYRGILDHYNAENRGFAWMRCSETTKRMAALLDAVEAGRVKAGGVRCGSHCKVQPFERTPAVVRRAERTFAAGK